MGHGSLDSEHERSKIRHQTSTSKKIDIEQKNRPKKWTKKIRRKMCQKSDKISYKKSDKLNKKSDKQADK